ncbi:MAG: bifunctional oligoribonuclease/PAP phosphatase NrnA [Planctomycetota bacterium]
MTAIDSTQFQQAASLLRSWRRPLVVTHERPDGDALGTVLAMRSILRRLGSAPLAMLFDPAPTPYGFLTENDPLPIFGQEVGGTDLGSVDGVLILDTCAYAQLTPLADWLRASSLPRIAVDHHVTRDLPANAYLVDTDAAAAALILYDWARALDWPLDDDALRGLFVGITTDTGWFAFGNTDGRALEAAAALVRHGLDPHELYVRIYQSERAAKVRLLGAALETLELLDGGCVAAMHLTHTAFARCGAQSADTEGIINEPLRIASVDVSVLFTESGDGLIRTSFRSKRHVDVAALAAAFGGGGHVNAAGARIPGTLAEVKERVLAKILTALETARN